VDKILYRDGEKDRLLKGKIISEDDLFVSLELDDSVYRIAKSKIISIRQGKNNGKKEHIDR